MACTVKSLKLKPKVRNFVARAICLAEQFYSTWANFLFIYSQAADGGLEFSVLDGDPTASPSESKPTNTGKLLNTGVTQFKKCKLFMKNDDVAHI